MRECECTHPGMRVEDRGRYPQKYPSMISQTKDILGLDAQQEETQNLSQLMHNRLSGVREAAGTGLMPLKAITLT